MTLQGVLGGNHDEEIDNTLHQYQVSTDRWWSALYRIIEGLAAMGRLSSAQYQPLEQQENEEGSDQWEASEIQ
ncbi:hypothetical protein SAY86_016155 [Trapa natans]|uniref:Uncharacterized protein n=1 Tax=Trapa natans TaxID=22666 RepID=A0AAN7L6A7_TRANT|nr:hypothetical protein SAY86_016155 [Trapa natans]